MIIKVILITAILATLLYFLTNRNASHTRAGVKLGILTLIVFAVGVVMFPGAATNLANRVGVGRGADLVLYLVTVAFLFFIISYYIRSKDEQKRLVTLARKIAILEAELRARK